MPRDTEKEKALGAKLEDALATAEALGKYCCTHCLTLWNPAEVDDDVQELEACPDCTVRCERCGTIKYGEAYGKLEHCL